VYGNDVVLLHDGEACFSAMLTAIEAGQDEILLDMYWFDSDSTGWRFASALARKAEQGVTVRILYDAVGSWGTDGRMFETLRRAGCSVHEYNPIAPWRQRFNIGVVNNRDHRKMLVVDGRVCFTGGINLADPWAPPHQGGDGWRDDAIRIEGPAAEQMRGAFLDTWVALRADESVRPTGSRAAGARAEPGTPVRILASRDRKEKRAIRREYLTRIRRARRRIFITNSYFVPDGMVRRALVRAAARGVDVRVLVPGESDVPAVQYAAQRLYDRLLRRGVGLHEWQGPVLHSKTAVVDGQWCTVGSYNLDWRSWRFNLEVTAIVEDRSVAAAMEERFNRDLQQARRVMLSEWRFRPLSDRLLERFFFLFRKLL
jgi:cardiolipin synthase